MPTPLPILDSVFGGRSLLAIVLFAVTLAAAAAAIGLVLWSALAPEAQLIAPTRWLEAWRRVG